MIGLQNKVLKSDRLTFRLLCENDFDDLHQILNDPSVTEPAGFKVSDNKAEFRVFFERLRKYNTAIAILKEDILIGYIHVNKWHPDIPKYNDRRCVSLGFVIGKEYQGNGYATETLITITSYLKQLFDFCFADHFDGNEASKKVIIKSGYKFVETYNMYFEDLEKDITCQSYVF